MVRRDGRHRPACGPSLLGCLNIGLNPLHDLCETGIRRSPDQTLPRCSANRRKQTMRKLTNVLIFLPLGGVALLSGCATYTPSPAPLYAYSYFAVPCETPGAFRAVPVVNPPSADSPVAIPDRTDLSPAVVSAAPANTDQAPDAVECLIAVIDRGRASRGARYYGGGYPYPSRYSYSNPYGHYPRPFYGSLGIGFGFGTHGYGGDYYGGGHFGRSHLGGGLHGGGHFGGGFMGGGHGGGHH